MPSISSRTRLSAEEKPLRTSWEASVSSQDPERLRRWRVRVWRRRSTSTLGLLPAETSRWQPWTANAGPSFATNQTFSVAVASARDGTERLHPRVRAVDSDPARGMWSPSPFHSDRGRRRAVSRLSERLPRFTLGGEWTPTAGHMRAPEAVTSWLSPNECMRILWSLPCNTSCWVAGGGYERNGICVRQQTRQCRIGTSRRVCCLDLERELYGHGINSSRILDHCHFPLRVCAFCFFEVLRSPFRTSCLSTQLCSSFPLFSASTQ